MKSFSIAVAALPFVFLAASCANNGGQESGRSTSIDSTNHQGAAPVEYSAGTPPTTVDTTMHNKTQEMKDQNAQRGAGTAGTGSNGNGANTSNTTDKSTTSGSANKGDADGDRKK